MKDISLQPTLKWLRTKERMDINDWNEIDRLTYRHKRNEIEKILSGPDHSAIRQKVVEKYMQYFPAIGPAATKLRIFDLYNALSQHRKNSSESYRYKLLIYLPSFMFDQSRIIDFFRDELSFGTSASTEEYNFYIERIYAGRKLPESLDTAFYSESVIAVFLVLEDLSEINDELREKLWSTHSFERVTRRSESIDLLSSMSSSLAVPDTLSVNLPYILYP